MLSRGGIMPFLCEAIDGLDIKTTLQTATLGGNDEHGALLERWLLLRYPLLLNGDRSAGTIKKKPRGSIGHGFGHGAAGSAGCATTSTYSTNPIKGVRCS